MHNSWRLAIRTRPKNHKLSQRAAIIAQPRQENSLFTSSNPLSVQNFHIKIMGLYSQEYNNIQNLIIIALNTME